MAARSAFAAQTPNGKIVIRKRLACMIRSDGYGAHGPASTCALQVLLLAVLALGACTSGPPINTSVDYQFPQAADDIRTYRVEFQGMPDFLKPMLRDEASRVLTTKGRQYTEGRADAVLLMAFENEPLESDVAEAGNDSGDAAATKRIIAARFNARVKLKMADSVSGDLIWAASLGRVHYVTEGAYMHESPARVAMRDAFRDVFADFPNRLEETYGPE